MSLDLWKIAFDCAIFGNQAIIIRKLLSATYSNSSGTFEYFPGWQELDWARQELYLYDPLDLPAPFMEELLHIIRAFVFEEDHETLQILSYIQEGYLHTPSAIGSPTASRQLGNLNSFLTSNFPSLCKDSDTFEDLMTDAAERSSKKNFYNSFPIGPKYSNSDRNSPFSPVVLGSISRDLGTESSGRFSQSGRASVYDILPHILSCTVEVYSDHDGDSYGELPIGSIQITTDIRVSHRIISDFEYTSYMDYLCRSWRQGNNHLGREHTTSWSVEEVSWEVSADHIPLSTDRRNAISYPSPEFLRAEELGGSTLPKRYPLGRRMSPIF